MIQLKCRSTPLMERHKWLKCSYLKSTRIGSYEIKKVARNSAGQLIYAYVDAIPDATAVIVTAGTERHSALRDYNRPKVF